MNGYFYSFYKTKQDNEIENQTIIKYEIMSSTTRLIIIKSFFFFFFPGAFAFLANFTLCLFITGTLKTDCILISCIHTIYHFDTRA